MLPSVYSSLLMAAVAVVVIPVSPIHGSYVPCEPCDQKALSMCPPVPVMGCLAASLVKEPGCGCCLTCALDQGQPCGVYTRPCARGLRCLPRGGEEKQLHALLHGRGVCASEKLYKLQMHAAASKKDGESPDEALLPIPESVLPQTKVPTNRRDHIVSLKAQAKKHAEDRKKWLARGRPAAGGLDYAATRPVEKLQPEFGPCRRRLDNLIQSMKDTSRVWALSLYIPNCDKKGFFKRKQCKPSRGRKRGICWCVDRFGVKLPGIDYSGGDLQCKETDSSSNSNTNE